MFTGLVVEVFSSIKLTAQDYRPVMVQFTQGQMLAFFIAIIAILQTNLKSEKIYT